MNIGIDHGYYAIKTRHFSFPAGISEYSHEPYTLQNTLEYGGQIPQWTRGKAPDGAKNRHWMRSRPRQARACLRPSAKQTRTSPAPIFHSRPLLRSFPGTRWVIAPDRSQLLKRRFLVRWFRKSMLQTPAIGRQADDAIFLPGRQGGKRSWGAPGLGKVLCPLFTEDILFAVPEDSQSFGIRQISYQVALLSGTTNLFINFLSRYFVRQWSDQYKMDGKISLSHVKD